MARSARPIPDAYDLPLGDRERDVFARYLPKAALVVLDRVRLFRVLHLAVVKLDAEGGMRKVRDDARALARFVAAFATGEYKEMPWRSVVFALAALLYFVSPVDLVPDFIPVLGFTDDVAVVFAVYKAITGDLARFERWRRRTAAPPVDAVLRDGAGASSGDGAPGRPRPLSRPLPRTR